MTGAQPADDPDIAGQTVLWRRITPKWYVPDANSGGYRITTQAFQNYSGTNSMSVCIADECGGTNDFLADFEGYGIAALTAAHCRSCNQGVVRDPTPDDAPHCHVVGEKGRANKRCLLGGATLIVAPHVTP